MEMAEKNGATYVISNNNMNMNSNEGELRIFENCL